MKLQRTRIRSFLFADYFLQIPADAQRLVILLHGYEQSGEKMVEKLGGILPASAAVLSPNGPFPLPRKAPEGYRIGFSWYFYNPHTDEYYMDMEIAVEFVAGLVENLKLTHLPTTLIGFSQGGYLAPFIAKKMQQVDHVIGLGSQYLVDEIELPTSYRADSVHGAQDDVVSAALAQKAHARVLQSGVTGQFRLLSETGHRIDDSMRKAVEELLSSR